MRGRTIRRIGEPRQCRGTALVDWEVEGPGGIEGRGTDVLRLAPDGRIAGAVGLGQG